MIELEPMSTEGLIIYLEEKTIESIKDYMRLNQVTSFCTAVNTLVAKGIHAFGKEGRGYIKENESKRQKVERSISMLQW